LGERGGGGAGLGRLCLQKRQRGVLGKTRRRKRRRRRRG